MKRLTACLLGLLFLCQLFPAGAEDIPYIVRNAGCEEKRVAVTVDDCYDMNHFRSVLDLCREHHVAVTFFIVGSALNEAWQPLLQEALELGCEIGNHTFGHSSLPNLTNRQIISQLLVVQQHLDAVLGYHYPMQVMRPPYGNITRENGQSISAPVKKAGYRHIVLWDVSQTDPDLAIRRVKPGSILLYHTNGKDVRCLAQLIPDLLADDFELVTVSELLELPAVATSTDLYTYDPHSM